MHREPLGRSPLFFVIATLATACGSDDTTAAPMLQDEVLVDPGSDAKRPDGTDSEPFASVADAVAAIEKSPDWKGRLTLKKGDHEIDEELVIPKTAELSIEAGATLAMGPGVSVHAQADMKIMGTEDEPVTFTWLEEGSHWGSLTNFEPTSQDNVLEWVIFEHGYETNFQGIGMRGSLSLSQAKARISHCTFRNNEGDDGLNLKASSSLIEYSTFENNVSDALDSDGEGTPEIRFSTFMHNGNDGVDLGEKTAPYVHDNLIVASDDKGISNGEAASARIEHNVIIDCGVGIGVKDGSNPQMRYNTLYHNDFGFRVFQEDTAYDGGEGSFVSGIIWGSTSADILFEFGSTTFSYSCIENIDDENGDPVIEGDGLVTKAKGCPDPLFADPDNGDFHLKSEAGRFDEAKEDWVTDDETSPGIDTGDPDADVGDEPSPNGGRVNMGTYAGTDAASKSP